MEGIFHLKQPSAASLESEQKQSQWLGILVFFFSDPVCLNKESIQNQSVALVKIIHTCMRAFLAWSKDRIG